MKRPLALIFAVPTVFWTMGCGTGPKEQDTSEKASISTAGTPVQKNAAASIDSKAESTTPEAPQITPDEKLNKKLDEKQALAELKKREAIVELNDQGKAVRVGLGQHNGTDDTLALVASLTDLEELDLYDDLRGAVKVTDKGLAHLKGLTNLKTLILTGTRVSDAGMQYLRELKKLEDLRLGSCYKVTDSGLKHIAGLTNMRKFVTQPSFGDEGLKQLKGMNKLQELNLLGNDVTDAGLEYLIDKQNLRELILSSRCKVTDKGIESLKKLLPDCRIRKGLTSD